MKYSCLRKTLYKKPCRINVILVFVNNDENTSIYVILYTCMHIYMFIHDYMSMEKAIKVILS